MIDIFLASGNVHKAYEFSFLLDPKVFKVNSAPMTLDVVEDGETYEANALIKAEAYYKRLQSPLFSDDSGIEVDSLPDELGIKSARFGGDGLNDSDRVNLLLERLEGLPKEKRSAAFVCKLCFYMNPSEIFFFEGRVEGFIGDRVIGDSGFGYDPVFHPRGKFEAKTLAQLSNWKKMNSHRAVASRLATQFFS